MNHTCESLKDLLGSFSLIRECDVVLDKSIRIATPFQYPDGSFIDVFLSSNDELFEQLELSDKGQTTAYLLNLQVKHWTTVRRKTLVSDICKSLGVQNDSGDFKIKFTSTEIPSIADYLVRLSQACIRVADVAFTQRFRTQSVFFEDVEEFISGIQVPYETRILLPGRYSKEVEFDFRVTGKKVTSIIQTASTSSASHPLLTEIFRKWYDVNNLRQSYRFVTVYDSNSAAFRDDDLERLSDVSEVVAFPVEEDRLKDTLAA